MRDAPRNLSGDPWVEEEKPKRSKFQSLTRWGELLYFFLVTFIHWASIRVNWPPSVLQPPLGFPSSVSWTSSGRSSLWRSRSWLPEQQIAGSAAPLCFSPSGDFLLRFPVKKKHIFFYLWPVLDWQKLQQAIFAPFHIKVQDVTEETWFLIPL